MLANRQPAHPPVVTQTPDPRPGHYYVSATEGRRYALLLGPYATHQEAIDTVDLARLECTARDPRAVWWAYGTSRLPLDHPNPPRGHLHAHLTTANPATAEELPA